MDHSLSVKAVPLKQIIVNLRSNGQVIIPLSEATLTQIRINWKPKKMDELACIYFELELTNNPGVWEQPNKSNKYETIGSINRHELGYILRDSALSSAELKDLGYEYGNMLRQEFSACMANAIESGSSVVVFDASTFIKDLYESVESELC